MTSPYKKPPLMSVESNRVSPPIRLLLQERINVEPITFYTLSWRTNWLRNTTNRFAYHAPSQGGFWIPSIVSAKETLELAENQGMLDGRYDDSYERFRHLNQGALNIIDSRSLDPIERQRLFYEITDGDNEPTWGKKPVFVVAETPGHTWRKIMILETEGAFCTFRSTTTDTTYGRIKEPRLPGGWYMDNAMQDADSLIMRNFLMTLREV